MGKRWIMAVFIFLVVSFLIWGNAGISMAGREDRFLTNKILEKLEEVLENQKLILEKITALEKKK